MSTRDVHFGAIEGFGGSQTANYDEFRPRYPPNTLDALVAAHPGLFEKGPLRVCDLAAGTGIFTRFLLEHEALAGAHIDAVEPVQKMLDRLDESLSDEDRKRVTLQNGTATSIPAEDETYDIVFVAQAFHWFATRDSLVELRRVLKRGGVLALTWNMEDDRTPWIARVRRLYEAFDGDVPQYRKGEWVRPFEASGEASVASLFALPLVRAHVASVQPKTRAALHALVGTKSYVARQDDETRARLRADIDAALDAELGPGGDEQPLAVDYDTELAFTTAV